MITVTREASREFESALAAFRCDDPNPMRQHLGLPLKVFCDDCGRESVPCSWGRELLCYECTEGRHQELRARYDLDRDTAEYYDYNDEP